MQNSIQSQGEFEQDNPSTDRPSLIPLNQDRGRIHTFGKRSRSWRVDLQATGK